VSIALSGLVRLS